MDWNPATIIVGVIGLLAAIVSFATNLLAYLREKGKKASDAEPSARLRIRQLSRGDSEPWINTVQRKLLPLVVVLGVCFLVASVWLLIKQPSYVAAWGVAIWTLAIVSNAVNQFRVFRRGTNAPSKVRREARVTVDGNYDEVFDRCESALRKLGAKVISLDRDSGQIHARTGLSWYSWGEKVDISVTKQADTVYSVVLSSDSIQVISADLGKNSKNLQVLLENL